jgi:hypothetical protein
LTTVTRCQAVLTHLILARDHEVLYYYIKISTQSLILYYFAKGAFSGCESIGDLFKCTVEKSPEVVSKIVFDTKTDGEVKHLPQLCIEIN